MRFFSALIANVLQGKIIVQTKKSYGHSRPTACFVALILGLLCFMTASAQEEPEPVMKFKVTYSIPSVTKSGVCFGFESVSTYPKEVVATFVYLEKESQIVYPGGDAEPLRVIKREDLVAASVKYGDGTWDLPLLEKFELNITADSNPESVTATKLSYNFFPILTRTTKDGIVLNNDFEFTATGTNRNGKKVACECTYSKSTLELIELEEIPSDPGVISLRGTFSGDFDDGSELFSVLGAWTAEFDESVVPDDDVGYQAMITSFSTVMHTPSAPAPIPIPYPNIPSCKPKKCAYLSLTLTYSGGNLDDVSFIAQDFFKGSDSDLHADYEDDSLSDLYIEGDSTHVEATNLSGGWSKNKNDSASLLEELGTEVNGVGPGRSLANKVLFAKTYYAASDIQATCAMLTAFVNEVWPRPHKTLTFDSAFGLTWRAQAIMADIGCN